jgi:carbon storage regulator CsrA
MLVLTRKVNESIELWKEGKLLAIITLAEMCNNKRARIGITATKDVEVFRSELENRTKKQQGETRPVGVD